MDTYAGVDWASDKHDVLVADATGKNLLAATVVHDEPGLRSLRQQLVRLNVRLVAIERPDGLLVKRLLDAGLRVLALHPNQVAATRDRFPGLGREVRSVRRVRAVRAGAHRSSPASGCSSPTQIRPRHCGR